MNYRLPLNCDLYIVCLPSTEVNVEHSLQQLVGDEGDAELRRRATHTRDGALPESAETLLGVNFTRGVDKAVVSRLALPGNNLKLIL